MKNDYLATIKCMLEDSIHGSAKIIPQVFCQHPGKNFSRSAKLPLENLLMFLIRCEGGILDTELMKACHFSSVKKISRSGFVQQRSKLLAEGVRFLFSVFNDRLPLKNKYKRMYTLVAVDGSEINIPYDRSQTATFNPPDEDHYKGFNTVHLNALYDISDTRYVDAVIGTGPKGRDERDAFYKMVDRFSDKLAPQTIFLADRGYSGYNSFAHVMEKGAYFVFRVKDVDKGGILTSYDLPDDDEFDLQDSRFLIKGKLNRIMKDQSEVYYYIRSNQRFDFIDSKERKLYYMPLRITRIKIDPDNYECLISNLPFSSFTTDDLKELYHLRWGIETSFRELKYNIGMVRFHSRKTEYVLQEVFARMIMFNFCSEVIKNIPVPEAKRGKRKHVYAVNFSSGVTACREYLSPWSEMTSEDLISMLSRCLHAVSPGRHYERYIRSQHYVTFSDRMG